MTLIYANVPINPEAFYTEADVKLQLGIAMEDQRKARDAGKLAFIRRGSSYVYTGQMLLDWLRSDKPEPETTARRIRRATTEGRLASTTGPPPAIGAASYGPNSTPLQSADVPAGSPITSERSIMPQAKQDPISRWNAAIRERMASGMTKSQAVRAVVREDPELHRSYLIMVNRHKPAAVQALIDM